MADLQERSELARESWAECYRSLATCAVRAAAPQSLSSDRQLDLSTRLPFRAFLEPLKQVYLTSNLPYAKRTLGLRQSYKRMST